MINRILCLILLLCIPFVNTFAQKKQTKSAKPVIESVPTAEEIAEQRAEEMLENTRNIVFLDSMVVNKDDFLSALRLSDDAGRFVRPDMIFTLGENDPETGRSAFINSMSSAVYHTQADTAGRFSLYATYRNGGTWTKPTPLQGLEAYSYADYPFVAADGVTLYFSAESEDGIGGLDLYVTRLNPETNRYVRPENMGFPFNSFANDYLLATDENAGIGVLVTDRRQPDDKVCVYWFVLDGLLDNTPYSPPADAEDPDSLLWAFADIAGISATQVGYEELVESTRSKWESAMQDNQAKANRNRMRFIINDRTVYTSLDQFRNKHARTIAKQWMEGEKERGKMLQELETLRASYAITRSKKAQQRLQNLETALGTLKDSQHKLAKEFRKAEINM